MNEIGIAELIAEARLRINANRIGMPWPRETDKDLVVIRRMVTALESLTATHTETEADPKPVSAPLPVVVIIASTLAEGRADAAKNWINWRAVIITPRSPYGARGKSAVAITVHSAMFGRRELATLWDEAFPCMASQRKHSDGPVFWRAEAQVAAKQTIEGAS